MLTVLFAGAVIFAFSGSFEASRSCLAASQFSFRWRPNDVAELH